MSNITIIQIIEFFGTFAFAISGIRLASSRQVDWFGAFFIGFVTAVGGGTIRDLLLGLPPFWMQNGIYIIWTALALFVVVLFRNFLVRLNYTFFTFDTIGLALFTVVGVEKTLQCGFSFWVAIIMGVITGAVGGIIRDIMINEIPLIFRKEIYALACFLGGVAYWICHLLGFPNEVCQIVTMLTVSLIRILSVKYKISLPILTSENQEDKPENK